MDTIAITIGPTTNGNVEITLIFNPEQAAYLNALAEARAYWAKMEADGPAPTDEGKKAVMAGFAPLIEAAAEAAKQIGRTFTMSDVMG